MAFINLSQLTKAVKGLINKINLENYITSSKIGDLSDLDTTDKSNLVAAINEAMGSGGVSDYSELTNKPSINSVTLTGNKSLSDLGIAAASAIPVAATATPKSNGIADVGSSSKYAKEDHVHPIFYPGSDEVTWNGGDLGQDPAPGDVEEAVEAVYNAIPTSASDVGALADTTLYAGAGTAGGSATVTNGIHYAHVDSTSTSTVFTATVPDVTKYYDGLTVFLKNGVVTSASGFTININNLGAKPVYSSMAAASRETTIFNVNYTLLLIYDSTRVDGGCWINYHGYHSDSNTVPTGYCTTAAGTAAKSATCTHGYRDDDNYFPCLFRYANTAANATLAIASYATTAAPIYVNGARTSSTNTFGRGVILFLYHDGAYYCYNDGRFPIVVDGSVTSVQEYVATKYTKPVDGIPKTDLAPSVQTSLEKADTALQSAPVTSVNGQTGAVSLSIPGTAVDVGAVAANQGATNANKIMTVGSDGLVVPEDNRFVVTLTPTSLDFSGTMDKTVAEIDAAYKAGKQVFFRIYSGNDYLEVNVTSGYGDGDSYPSFNSYCLTNTPFDALIYLWTGTGASGNQQTYNATIYPLSTSQSIPAPSSASTGDFLCFNGTEWAATTVPNASGVSF